ncbi:glycosyltransferase family 4 protein [candidate division KSB1 bacterium]|nr:glycosyltransferase family 4 protein [candidate division KSB1 bacterium]
MDNNGSKIFKIAFILNFFPMVSETFIISEIQNLLKRHIQLDLFSLFKSDKYDKRYDLGELEERVCFLQPLLKCGILAKSHISFFCRHPLRYGKTLIFALKNRNERFVLKTILKILINTGKNREIFSKKERQNIFVHFMLVMPFAGLINSGGYNHVHAHYADTSTSFALLISKLCMIPYSFTTHATDLFVEPYSMDIKMAEAKFVITCTEYNKKYIVDKFKDVKKEKIIVNYHGVDTDNFQPEKTEKRESNKIPVILSVGRLVPKKGFDVLLRACGILKNEKIRFKCKIIGHGPEKDNLLKLVKDFNLSDEVEFLGTVPPAEMKKYYALSDVFALPCRITETGDRDGIPNVLAEAMAMGKAVVSTKISGIPEIVLHGKTGMLIEPENPEQLAKGINDLLANPEKRKQIGRNARSHLINIFDKQVKCDELVDIFVNQVNMT